MHHVPVTISADTARDLYRAYQKHKHWSTPIDREVMAAYQKLAQGNGSEKPEFYKAKVGMARFYFDHILPRAKGHATSMVKPSRSLTRLPVESFVFE